MCNGFVSRFLSEFGVAVDCACLSGGLECSTACCQKGRKKDRAAICPVSVGGVYRSFGNLIETGLRGSYTVEASLIVPIVLFAVLFVINSAFYMHNQTVVRETVYEIAIYATTLNRENINEMKSRVQEKYLHSIEGRLISMNQPEISVKVENDSITVKISGEMNTAGGSLLPSYNHAVVNAEKTVSFCDPKQTLRLLKKMKSLMK